MKILISWILVLTVGMAVTAAAEMTKYFESMAPKIMSEWCTADDGNVSACFVTDKTTYGTNEILMVRCAIRNNTDKSITVLRPFGDTFYAHSAGLTLFGPAGAIPYSGAMKEYMLGTSSFLELPPHTIADETLSLPVDIFPGLGSPGLYVIGYTYISNGYPKQPPPENYWQGRIRTRSVTILIQ